MACKDAGTFTRHFDRKGVLMAGPTNLEQLLLEYINEARLDPW